jgi:hypothetical protein
LTKDDFVVSDEVKPQPISLFSNDIQPITVVVMLDRSGSMVEHTGLVRDAAEQFVRKLLPDDKARIGSLSRDIIISPGDFTSDQQTLVDILRNDLQGPGPSPIWTAVDRSITALLNEHGHDNSIRGQIATDLKDVIHRTEYDEIMVYAIGLADTADSGFVVQSIGRGPRRVPLAFRSKSRLEPPDPGLRRLAEQSGGGYFELDWHKDLAATFTRVADELHRQYWLAFPPSKLDEKVHTLRVKVKRPDLIVRARKTYVASRAAPARN